MHFLPPPESCEYRAAQNKVKTKPLRGTSTKSSSSSSSSSSATRNSTTSPTASTRSYFKFKRSSSSYDMSTEPDRYRRTSQTPPVLPKPTLDTAFETTITTTDPRSSGSTFMSSSSEASDRTSRVAITTVGKFAHTQKPNEPATTIKQDQVVVEEEEYEDEEPTQVPPLSAPALGTAASSSPATTSAATTASPYTTPPSHSHQFASPPKPSHSPLLPHLPKPASSSHMEGLREKNEIQTGSDHTQPYNTDNFMASGASTPPADGASEGHNLWMTYHHFSSNSKATDPLIYALTRKEAWMQYNRANVPGKNMDIIELWTIMSIKFVLKGSLMFSPQSKILGQIPGTSRVLDIHGIFKAPWGWQVAMENPQAKVYGYQFDHAGMEGSAFKEGPSNYTTVVGDSLGSLPFEDGFFDVVTCKSLWYFLQNSHWSEVLKEIHRVIKPGGAIELIVCDYDVVNKGSSDEYWWNRLVEGVSRHNVDPYPSTSTGYRLAEAGFEEINRALLALPRGWPGQMGHLTDFMSMYYSDSMFSYFADLSPSELELFRDDISRSGNRDTMSATCVTLFYATKET